jgi:hypothetical protein
MKLSLSSPTTVCEFSGDQFQTYTVRPEDFGLTTCDKADLSGGTAEETRRSHSDILNGKKGPKCATPVLLKRRRGAVMWPERRPPLPTEFGWRGTNRQRKSKGELEQFIRNPTDKRGVLT